MDMALSTIPYAVENSGGIFLFFVPFVFHFVFVFGGVEMKDYRVSVGFRGRGYIFNDFSRVFYQFSFSNPYPNPPPLNIYTLIFMPVSYLYICMYLGLKYEIDG